MPVASHDVTMFERIQSSIAGPIQATARRVVRSDPRASNSTNPSSQR